MKKGLISIGLIVLFLGTTGTVFAAGSDSCQPIYGGGIVCPQNPSFTVHKQVLQPGGNFVDNLTPATPYAPGDEVAFQITVQNTSNAVLPQVSVIDALPPGFTYQGGPGMYSSSNQTVTFTLTDLAAKQSQTISVLAKIPANQKTGCVTNSVKAINQLGENQVSSSQVCIAQSAQTHTQPKPIIQPKPTAQPQPKPQVTKPVTQSPKPTPMVYKTPPMKKTPPTGPEDFVLPLLSASGAIGYYLRKKSR